MMPSRAAAAALVALATAWPAVSFGQDAAVVAAVREHDRQAQASFDAEDYATALRELGAAQALLPVTTRLYNIAVCHQRLGELERAIIFYRLYLEAPDALGEQRGDVADRIAEIEAELAARREAEPRPEGPAGGTEAAGGLPGGDEPAPLDATVTSRARLAPAPFYATLTTTLALSVTWGVLAGVTWSRHEEFLGLDRDDPIVEVRQDQGQQLALASDVLLGALVAAAVTTAVLAIFTRWAPARAARARTAHLQVSPWLAGLPAGGEL
jgi:tetratricopeptide (TPR) repeat protein